MLKKFIFRLQSIAIAVIAAALVAGCSSSGYHAPVEEHGAERDIERGAKLKKLAAPVATPAKKVVPRDKDGRPQIYVVQKGDTLYSIAFNYGLDYREIAELNSIHNHGVIQVGKELRLPPASTSTVVTTMVESKPLEVPVKNQPRVAKLPYTEQAVTQIEKMQEDLKKSEPVMVVKVQAKFQLMQLRQHFLHFFQQLKTSCLRSQSFEQPVECGLS